LPAVRIALVSPYSWSYPGGVTRHVEALAERFLDLGHEVRVLAPTDPDDRVAHLTHRGARPEHRPLPDYGVSLGRTLAFSANGALSPLVAGPYALTVLRRELREGRFDVVHVHEPIVPLVGWDVVRATRTPLVGTFHVYSENRLTNGIATGLGARLSFNRLRVRIAVSEAAAWTGRRFFGGDYRVIPNGVHLPEAVRPRPRRAHGAPLRIAFVGQVRERKGLPVLLRAFEALREHVPAELTVIGASAEEVHPLLLDGGAGVRVLGRVPDERKRAALEAADVLCAPSLGGESFGMVLTEAFAAGLPVVASDIAGYRDVVRDGVDGLLVPRGDGAALAEALRGLWLDPDRHAALARGAAARAPRYAWPRVADEVLDAYADAIAMPAPASVPRRVGERVGVLPAGGAPRVPAQRLATLEPARAAKPRPALRAARRVGLGLAGVAGLAGAGLALHRIGVGNIAGTLVRSSPSWVLAALVLMVLSMALRAVSWHAILRAALPEARPRWIDALQGTAIGVLMSATLPARLGEPSRAFVVARRLGRVRERLPVVLGTLVSQTLLNLLALVGLGLVMVGSVGVFRGHAGALIAVALLPVVVLLALVAAPAVLRGDGGALSRSRRLARLAGQARRASGQARAGLLVFRSPRLGGLAAVAQLAAWALQWVACYALLVALGLHWFTGLAAAAAVLFAVNVSAVLPATPSNLGVFQAACVAVLSAGYGVSTADALGYGVILQAVEVATAVVMGMPALVKEGLSWRDVRLRALHATPVHLPAQPEPRPAGRPSG
jgi:phosphatidylinositol alpha-mannosyltransferase